MCSRFELNSNAAELARQFSLPEPPMLPNLGEFRPTDRVLVIDPGHTTALRAWGIPAPWDGKPIFNARAETLTEKPTFRPYLEGRCVVPASAYFEWKKDGKQRTKMRIARRDDADACLCFAALGDADHTTIVTCPAAPAIAEVHGRMPVLLEAEQISQWLDLSRPLSDVADLLAPREPGGLTATPAEDEPRPKTDQRQPDLFA